MVVASGWRPSASAASQWGRCSLARSARKMREPSSSRPRIAGAFELAAKDAGKFELAAKDGGKFEELAAKDAGKVEELSAKDAEQVRARGQGRRQVRRAVGEGRRLLVRLLVRRLARIEARTGAARWQIVAPARPGRRLKGTTEARSALPAPVSRVIERRVSRRSRGPWRVWRPEPGPWARDASRPRRGPWPHRDPPPGRRAGTAGLRGGRSSPPALRRG